MLKLKEKSPCFHELSRHGFKFVIFPKKLTKIPNPAGRQMPISLRNAHHNGFCFQKVLVDREKS